MKFIASITDFNDILTSMPWAWIMDMPPLSHTWICPIEMYMGLRLLAHHNTNI